MSETSWTGAPIGTVVHAVGTTVTLYLPAVLPTIASGTWTA